MINNQPQLTQNRENAAKWPLPIPIIFNAYPGQPYMYTLLQNNTQQIQQHLQTNGPTCQPARFPYRTFQMHNTIYNIPYRSILAPTLSLHSICHNTSPLAWGHLAGSTQYTSLKMPNSMTRSNNIGNNTFTTLRSRARTAKGPSTKRWNSSMWR